MKNLTILFLFSICSIVIVSAQNDSVFNYIKVFRGTNLVKMQTTENAPQNGFNFVIQHRFGKADISNGLLDDFFGMDLTSNIRLGFAVRINKFNYVGIGRTKFGKYYDFEWKRILLRQTKDNRKPLSIAFYTNIAVTTADLPSVHDDNFFGDGITPFKYRGLHRWSTSTQLIFSKKFGRIFSFQIAPTYVHKNLVPIDEYNKTIVVPVGGSIRTGLSSSVIFEYTYNYTNNSVFRAESSYAIGWEYQTPSHIFQVFLCNNNDLLDQNFYINHNNASFLDGTFILGFNIHKTLWIKK